jgi:DNA-binding transcriptional ArsR family regulator
MDSTFDVIREPNRRRILDLLCVEQRSVGELCERLELSQPTVSKHLGVLRRARLVHAEVSAQRRLYRLNPMPLLELDAWLEPYRKFWNERLDALGRHLDRRAAEAAATPAAQRPSRRRQRLPASERGTPRRKVKS